ncbi:hypothetical protein LSM04_000256 [Trypanosoma melophagium]|uniref:uncharacterized protein n=1 Tax=Trypanosoma melophagium TaxID=715481 RepID=UPI00351A973A|nr:hypothetical protein LSM04_000256 [Trypanosoma melophagium]
MDILSSSKLIYSRYSECVTLLHPASSILSLTTTTAAAQRKTERVSTRKKRDVNSHETNRDDIAFLSSVQTPSEVCLALACVARPRHCDNNNMTMNGDNRMLVFVPYDIPRDEIFVEMPLSAFKEARDPTRGRGLQLMVLNEYSLLCFRPKDGLPPRKGLFITFRTARVQQLFREVVDDLICNDDEDDNYHHHNSLVFNTSVPVKRLNRIVQTREDKKIRIGTTPTSGAIVPRGSTYAIYR